jgi:hypothetical protein
VLFGFAKAKHQACWRSQQWRSVNKNRQIAQKIYLIFSLKINYLVMHKNFCGFKTGFIVFVLCFYIKKALYKIKLYSFQLHAACLLAMLAVLRPACPLHGQYFVPTSFASRTGSTSYLLLTQQLLMQPASVASRRINGQSRQACWPGALRQYC